MRFFDRLDFQEFYTIKSLCGADFGVKIFLYIYLGVHLGPQNSLRIARIVSVNSDV